MRRMTSAVAAVMLALALIGVSTWAQEPTSTPVQPSSTTEPPSSDLAQLDPVAEILAGMTLRQKVGQLFVSRVYGDRAVAPAARYVAANRRYLGADDAAELVRRFHVGGIVYFGYAGNLRDAQRVAALSNGIQTAAAEAGVPPVLISTDQEGGMVRRLGPPAVLFPGAMAVGATGEPALAFEAARVTGEELRAVGIHQDLAPVADVNANPANPVIGIRSFGSHPDDVAEMVAAQVEGFAAAGTAATAKHFPGHGDTDIDSHVGLPVIRKSRSDWRSVDAPPFEAAIDAGVDVIMTAHVVVPSLDRTRRPATLSRTILTDVLRDELGFEGVVMTDSLTMAAVRDRYGDRRVPVLALQAGADLLADPPHLPRAFRAVLRAVRQGELSEARLDRSVTRILRLKERLGLLEGALVDEGSAAGALGSPEHKAVSRDVADAGVTVLRDRKGWLPFRDDWSVLLTGWNDAGIRQLADRLRDRGHAVATSWTRSNPSTRQVRAALKASRQHDVTVVVVASPGANPGQRALVRRLLGAGRRVVVVDAWSPYDAAWFATAPAQLATYGTVPVSMRGLARVLSGETVPSGRLPVRVPRLGRPRSVLFPVGHGLTTGGSR